MGFVNDLFDRIGTNRYNLDGLPELPQGYEWLLYEQDGTVFVELYFPDPMTCSYGQLNNTDPEQVLTYAKQIYAATFQV